ncbi:Structural maintenance of chromosomes protein 5, partial [Coelomomyces lativittatus]
ERAVSTILFLLSLQRTSKAPFRLVDEINQGMDSRNERLVHHLLVQAASQPDAPQYFLITPKLLSDLTYSESMKVHCIMNGTGVHPSLVDSERTFFTTHDYVQRKRSLLQSTA